VIARALQTLRRLRSDRDGSTAIEFALIGPAFIALLLGVLQVGVGMQSYNALRNITADVSRHTVIQYQTDNRLTKNQIKLATISTATSSPYLLDANNLRVAVDPATIQRVDGATEFTINVSYQVPSILNLSGWASPTISHTRPIFTIDD
jgi:Flp pilus assembly protein TadG